MPESKITRITSSFTSLFFLLAIFIPLLGTLINIEDKTNSTENRVLAALPDKPDSIKTLKRYPKKFNAYFQDNFGFRKNLLQYNQLKFWIGDSPSEKVTLGKNDWLFFNGEAFTDLLNATRGIRRLSDKELKQYASALSAKYHWLKRQNIDYLFVVAPNKHSIYPEYLPNALSRVNDTTLTDQFFKYMRDHTDVPVLDLRQALINRKSPDITLYFRTDTHWNYMGSNIAQYEIAKVLARLYPDEIVPVLYQKKDFTLRKGPGGDLSRLLGLKHQFTDDYPSPAFQACSQRPQPTDGNYAKTFTTQCGKSNLNALVFRDSFFEYMYQYISIYFKRVTFVSKRIHFADISSYIQKDKPDIVVEEWAERFLTAVPELEPEFLPVNQ